MDYNSATDHRWVDPAFSRYDPNLAYALTVWLYSDPGSNPLWNQPDKWAGSGRVQYVMRTLGYTDLANGSSETQKLSMSGGRNSVIFARTASVVASTAPGTLPTMPNERLDYVYVEQKRTDGWIEIENQPLANCYGTGSWPFTMPVPERWYANSDRNIKITNGSGDTSDIYLSWVVAMLDTGR